MKPIILNEMEMVKSWIDNNQRPEGISISKLILYLVKYYYTDEIKLKDIKSKIFKIIDSYNLSVAEYQEYKAAILIKKYYNLIKDGKTSLLRDIDSIPIYQEDIDLVNEAENIKQKKFLFTMIVLARFTNKYGWVYFKHSDIYKLANVSITNKSKDNIIYELYKLNLLKMTNKVDDLKIGIDKLFIPKESDTPILEITNMKHLGNQYIEYSDKTQKCCERCGKLVKIKSKNDGSTKYCNQCANELQLQWQRESMQKLRNSNM